MSNQLTIRSFRLTDLDRILEIEAAVFAADAYDRKLFAEYFHKCGDLVLVMERRRNICGYILTCMRGRATSATAELVSIAVDPDAQRCGAASALLESTLRRLRRRSIARFSLIVKVTNQPALRFYEKYGFTKVRTVRQYYEDAADGYLMAKNL
jgi:ribosomal-protein-alanine N-acetyltransferase